MQDILMRGLSFILFLLVVPITASAQFITQGIDGCDFETGWLTAGCIPRFIGHGISIVIGMVAGFFMFNVLVSGYQIAIASATAGDKTSGYRRLIWAIVGMIVSVLAFVIMNFFITIITG